MTVRSSKILTVAVPERLRLLFESHSGSYSVLTSATAEEALALIEAGNIQLCVLNDELADMEQFIKSVRNTPWGADLPLLVITSTKTHEELFKLGADAFFGTGDTDDQFLHKIELLLGLSDSSRTTDFSNRAETDNPFHHALQYAEQLVLGMEGETSTESLRVLSSDESLQSLVISVEAELRGQLVGTETKEISEGLETVEPQAYIGHQLSVGERMESEGRDSSYDVIVQAISSHDVGIGDSVTPTEEVALSNGGFVHAGVLQDAASSVSVQTPLSRTPVSGTFDHDKGGTLSQPFEKDASKQTPPPQSPVVPLERLSRPVGHADRCVASATPNRMNDRVDEHLNDRMNDLSAPDERLNEISRVELPQRGGRPSQPPHASFFSSTMEQSEVAVSVPSDAASPSVETRLSVNESELQRSVLLTDNSEIHEGRLESVPLWRIFVSAMKNRLSGRLLVTHRDVERQVFFDRGAAVVVYSNAREDRLVELLFREGRISERQYENASMTIATSGRRAGVVMVEKGIISARELFPIVRYHYESILFDMFGWTEGSWKFFVEPYQLKERILLDSRMTDIVLDAFRNTVPRAQISQLIPADAMVTVPPQSEENFESVYLTAKEQELLEWCNGNRSVRWLATRFSVDVTEVQAVLAALAALGWVEVGGASSRFSVLPFAAKDIPAQSPVGEEQLDVRHETTRINEKYQQVEEGTYFDIAEVPPDASTYEIRKSLQRLKSLYSPKRYLGLQITDLHEKLSVIGSVLDEAGDVLFDETLREQYRRALF